MASPSTTVEQTFTNYRTLLGNKLTELQGQKDSRSMYTPTQVSDFLLDLWLALNEDEGGREEEEDSSEFDIDALVPIPAEV